MVRLNSMVFGIHASITFDRAHLIAMRLALCAEPRLVVEPDCFDDQRVSVPLADGISIPCRIGIVRKFAPVHPDFAGSCAALRKTSESFRECGLFRKAKS